MNKATYLNTLNSMLDKLPEDERKDILYDYEEHFRIGMENGKTEEEISIGLGDPRAIARQYKACHTIKTADVNTTAGNTIRAVFAIGVLGFFNLFVAVILFAPVAIVLAAFYIVGFSLAVSGIAGGIATFIAPFFPNYIDIGINPFSAICFSVGLFTFGVLFLILSYYLTRLFFRLTVRYLKWNIQFVNK